MGGYSHEDHKPAHKVTLDAFYIDQYEVTNVRYSECVDLGKCVPPAHNELYDRDSYYDNQEFENYPVVFVSWEMADKYCSWRNARLPSEAEWEKAARGGLEGAPYPWGDESPVCRIGAFNGAKFDDEDLCPDTNTEQVGSYGANGYGLYDMAGNVWEWTADWYDVYPGGDPAASSDFGEKFRVIRGGSWLFDRGALEVNFRGTDVQESGDHFGFRCVRDVGISPTITQDEYGIPMALVPAGSFMMGSEDGEDDEKPVHTVMLDAFYIDQYEVTNQQFASFLNEVGNKEEAGVSWMNTDNHASQIFLIGDTWQFDTESAEFPVIDVSWYGARAFCEWRIARLPTETEWEKAARGGLEGNAFPWGNDPPLCEHDAQNGAKFDDGEKCHKGGLEPVGSYTANGYGLYDMAGNVKEWVQDWYVFDYYANSPADNPLATQIEEVRVNRGGSWFSQEYELRVSYRNDDTPDTMDDQTGFRCARDVDDAQMMP
jgi:formylglycine-generating enzyme required for sulfatase activity